MKIESTISKFNKSFIIHAKAMTLYRRLHEPLMRFPKHERNHGGMVSQIRLCLSQITLNISLGNKVHSKRKHYFSEADAYIEQLSTLITLSFDFRYISRGFFEDLDLKITELKKMITELIKNSTK